MKVALVHYWLVGMRGGEKVLEALCDMYPGADIFTLVMDPEKISSTIKLHRIETSFLQKIGGKRLYQKMLPLMPFALEAFDLTDYDLVISSESGPAKAIVTRPDALHICYCHSPMRYIWDLEPQYKAAAGSIARFVMGPVGVWLRQWDVTTAARVDVFVANSQYVSKRIEKFYRRESVVINPPVELSRFSHSPDVEDVYLCAGQITPYKKVELAIEAFNNMGKRLDIVGDGATPKMKAMASSNIRFLGALSDVEIARKFSTCKALIFPGVEDFGILPLEVMASGRPVIAYGRGGATETVIDGVTGLLFDSQSAEGIAHAVRRFERDGVAGTPETFRMHSEKFSQNAFRLKFFDLIASRLN